MGDIVERLREAAKDRAQMERETPGAYPRPPRQHIEWQAADEIAALRAENARLREALVAIRQRGIERDVKWAGMNAHDIARAALAQPEAGGE